MDEPISHPLRLPMCGHSFCFSCIRSWQEASSVDALDLVEGSGDGYCPLCRTAMQASIGHYAAAQAHTLQFRASKLPVERHDEKMKLLHLAVSECNHVLEVEGENLQAMTVKIRALAQFDPHETIKVTNEILQLDIMVRKKECQLKEMLDDMRTMQSEGHLDLAMDLQNKIHAEYGKVHQWPRVLAPGADGLFDARICMAKAYAAVNRWHDAAREYKEMMQWYERTVSPNAFQPIDLIRLRWCREGYARCALHLGSYDAALSYSQNAYAMNRVIEGSHKLVAQAQRALARSPVQSWGLGQPTHANCTLKDAVETMYRAMVHEAPWNDANQQINREFLQELLEELEAEEK
jgi:tetratricopeptide (TPR) repeat protein